MPKYKVQYTQSWQGYWIYDALNDVSAWTKAENYKNRVTCPVGIIDIHELDNNNEPIRKLPDKQDCITIRAKSKKSEKQEEKAIYKAYFSDGECSGPFIATIKENDIDAINIAYDKLNFHKEYNNLDNNEIILTKVEEINENMNFEVNIMRKNKIKNRFLTI